MASESKRVGRDPADVFEDVLRAVRAFGYKIDQVDRANHLVNIRTGMSLKTWAGQEISVLVSADGEGVSTVDVSSRRRGFQVVDWGEGKKIARRILDAVPG